MENFNEFMLSTATLDALNKIEILCPTEIQVLAIPPMLAKHDVIGQAQTGTGKTFAYSIPIVEMIDSSLRNVQALVLCPTRELSIQVSVEMKKLLTFRKDVKVATIYGGESYEKQFKALRENPAIIIGTPGRIIDHIKRKTLDFSKLSLLILDEADEMLKMGFQEDLETILNTVPAERQTALFSATIPPFIEKIAKNYLTDPVHLVVERKTLTVDSIDQRLFYVKKEQKKDLLIRILDINNFKSCMIFCNTKSMVDELVVFLQKHKYLVDGLHGDLKQMVRDRVMGSFRSGNIKILIATDVAARGIDVDGIEGIINYDIPAEDELYVHRIGRTGRAGSNGVALTFASPREQYRISQIQKYTHSTISLGEIPSIDDIKAAYNNRLCKDILDQLKKETPSNSTILKRLFAEGYEASKVIDALIAICNEKIDHVYNEIEPVRVAKKREDNSGRNYRDDRSHSIRYSGESGARQKRDSADRPRRDRDSKYSDDRRERRGGNVTFRINLGKSDKLRPQALVNLCNKVAGLHKEHIGDIVINEEDSTLDIASDGIRFFKGLSGKTYNNKRITIKEVNGNTKKKS